MDKTNQGLDKRGLLYLFPAYPNLWLIGRPDGEEEELALLVALAEDGLDPVDALAQLGRHVGLRLLRVVHEGLLAAGDARAQAVDEGGRPPPRLGGRQGLDHVRRDRRQRFWRAKWFVTYKTHVHEKEKGMAIRNQSGLDQN